MILYMVCIHIEHSCSIHCLINLASKSKLGLIVRTKVIVTLGPTSAKQEIITKFIEEGVDGIRINFAHTTHEEARTWLKMIKNAEESLNKRVAIIGDLKGASIRLGIMNNPLEIKPGMKLELRLTDKTKGKEPILPLPPIYEMVLNSLEVNDIISMDDGRIRLRVIEVSRGRALLEAETTGLIKSNRALVIVGKDFDLPLLTEKDIKDLEFVVKNNFTYVGLSCIRKPQDIDMVRKYINEIGESNDTRVIAKIETIGAVKNLSKIVEKTDAVLVARGDLGMIFGLENIPHLQKEIVDASIKKGKIVIVATQLLDSMINNPVPTRSEVVDVVEAIQEGVDALMLTNETAIGKYPIESVKWLKRIIDVVIYKTPVLLGV